MNQNWRIHIMTMRIQTTTDNPILKDACELFWIVKGHIPSCMYYNDTVEETYHSYFDRVWRWDPNEVYLRRQGFDQAYKQFLTNWPEA